MTDSTLLSFDLNLLVIFSTLMREKSVTRCAMKLNVGQSAISNSLNRLRATFDDPLFIRVGRGVEPTDKAQEIARLIGPALDLINVALVSEENFAPDSFRGEFSIAVSSGFGATLIMSLIKPIRQLAPLIGITVERSDLQLTVNRLAIGQSSIGIGYFSDEIKGLQAATLKRCKSVLVRARGTEAVDSIRKFCSRPHAVLPFGEGLELDIDKRIALSQLQRHVAVRLPSSDAVEEVISGSNIVAVMPDFEAQRLGRSKQFSVDRLPDGLESTFDLRMVWSDGKAFSTPDLWFRRQVLELVRAQPQNLELFASLAR